LGALNLVKRTVSSVKDRTGELADAIKALPEETATVAGRATENIRRAANVPGSAQQRYADAPLGITSLIPNSLGGKQVRKVAGFVAPSPRQLIESNRAAASNPSAGNITRAALNDVAVATLPLAAADAAKGVSAGARGTRVLAATKGLPLSERVGLAARSAVAKDTVFHGTSDVAAQAIKDTGFKGTPFPSIRGSTEPVSFVTRNPKLAMRFAENAAARDAARPALVAAKVVNGAPVQGIGHGGEAFADAALKPLGSNISNIASKQGPISRIRGSLRAEMQAAAARGQRQRELPGKITALREELGRMGTGGQEQSGLVDFVRRGERGSIGGGNSERRAIEARTAKLRGEMGGALQGAGDRINQVLAHEKAGLNLLTGGPANEPVRRGILRATLKDMKFGPYNRFGADRLRNARN
jgi:hypothetical protein